MPEQFQFEPEFQLKILALIMRDQTVIPTWRALLKPHYFSDTTVVQIVRWIYDYWDQYHRLPTREVLRRITDSNPAYQRNEALRQLGHQWIDAGLNVHVPDRDFILSQVSDFCKVQEWSLATIRAATILQKGQNPEEIPRIMQAAQERLAITQGSIGLPLIGMNDQERQQMLFTKPSRNCILSPWPTVNEKTGGVAKKEMTVFAGPTGYGKSWFLYALAAHAISQGKLVVVYTLEMSAILVALRIYSIITGISSKEIEAMPSRVNEKINLLRQCGGELIVKEYPTNGANVSDVRDHITKLSVQYGRVPDVVVLDYADLLVPQNLAGRGEEDSVVRHILATIYKSLRRIAVELELAMVTASQTNKSTLAKEIINVGDLEESFKKAHIADIIWAICQTPDEYKQHCLRLFLAKNRNEERGAVIDMNLDFGHGVISESRSFIPNTATDVNNSTFQQMMAYRQQGQ